MKNNNSTKKIIFYQIKNKTTKFLQMTIKLSKLLEFLCKINYGSKVFSYERKSYEQSNETTVWTFFCKWNIGTWVRHRIRISNDDLIRLWKNTCGHIGSRKVFRNLETSDKLKSKPILIPKSTTVILVPNERDKSITWTGKKGNGLENVVKK